MRIQITRNLKSSESASLSATVDSTSQAPVDVHAVAEYAKTIPDVVFVKENRYTCADPGQEEIRKAIKAAEAQPRRHRRLQLHECMKPTFRRTVAEAGLNSFLYEMANIREFSSWCHQSDPASSNRTRQRRRSNGSCQSPINAASANHRSPSNQQGAYRRRRNRRHKRSTWTLLSRASKSTCSKKARASAATWQHSTKPSPPSTAAYASKAQKWWIAHVTQTSQYFANSELVKCDGYVGNFKVKIRKNPRYVIPEKCTGCGECRDACPIEYPNEWDMNLGTRKAISVPFDQAVPLVYSINKDYCIECFKCTDVCGERDAIDFDQKPEEVEIDVGAIVVSTGFDVYEPYDMPLLGYGKYPNVVTSMEFERLILAAGPTGGKVIRQSDGARTPPHRLHPMRRQPRQSSITPTVATSAACTPSNMWCSSKRSTSKTWKSTFSTSTSAAPAKVTRNSMTAHGNEASTLSADRVSRIDEDPATHNLTVHSEDSLLGQPIEVEADMVVLATASIPKKGSDEIARILNLSRDADGFFMEAHPKLKPLDAPTDGIFFAGACAGLKDIPYSVSQGSGAASRAATVISKPKWKIEPIISVVDESKCKKCGVCVDKCPYGAIRQEEGQPASIITASCHGCGTCVAECPSHAITQMHFTDAQIMAQIRAALETNPEEKILAFLCNWCSYAGADLAGISRCDYPASVRAIRVMCSGRVSREFILEALRLGAGAVLVGACHMPYDCHYINGNYKMKERTDALKAYTNQTRIESRTLPRRIRLRSRRHPLRRSHQRNR